MAVRFFKIGLLLVAATIAVVLPGCGKKGPPVPPADYRMTQPEDQDGSAKLKDLEIREESGLRLFQLYSKDHPGNTETAPADDEQKDEDADREDQADDEGDS